MGERVSERQRQRQRQCVRERRKECVLETEKKKRECLYKRDQIKKLDTHGTEPTELS